MCVCVVQTLQEVSDNSLSATSMIDIVYGEVHKQMTQKDCTFF